MKAFFVDEDKTVMDVNTNKMIFYPFKKFKKEIVESDNCFICGACRQDKPFNEEHVVPQWILRRFNLFSKKVRLPNGRLKNYGSYTMPCCSECNKDLAEEYEEPVSKLLSDGYKKLVGEIEKNPENKKLLFRWMSLLFIKMHLKDTGHLLDVDRRLGSETIASLYNWGNLHHIHCIARSHHTEAIIDERTYGTLLIFERTKDNLEKFNLIDSHIGRTMAIELDDFCIVAVLDDSLFTEYFFQTYLEKISDNKISSLQFLEIVCHLTCLNVYLLNRPTYRSDLMVGPQGSMQYEINMENPEKEVGLFERDKWQITPGIILAELILKNENLSISPEELEGIKNNGKQFIFNEDGSFKKSS